MRILVIGQTTLHWGRLEYGNIGNYYVIDPFFRELRRIFPNDEICTTLQMSSEFMDKYSLIRLEHELYASWEDANYLFKALAEYAIADIFHKTGWCVSKTAYIEEVLKSDIVIDYSGDIWGDNADLIGEDRFLIGLLKDRCAQLMGRKVFMLAGSPGPFENHPLIMPFIHEVFDGFSLVTNRESISQDILKHYGFRTDDLQNLACPSILYENTMSIPDLCMSLSKAHGIPNNIPVGGFTICGWNMVDGPFTKWPRSDEEYIIYAEAIEYMINDLGLAVILFSHSNGFVTQPEFSLIPGRDVPLIKQLFDIVIGRGKVKESMIVFHDQVLRPDETRSLISGMDILVSGRLHGSVAGLTQSIPTVMIDYGHEPKAHKIRGFAREFGVENFVADPSIETSLIKTIRACWDQKDEYKKLLDKKLPIVKQKARKSFDLLRDQC